MSAEQFRLRKHSLDREEQTGFVQDDGRAAATKHEREYGAFTVTFNIETLWLIALVNLVGTILVGTILTKTMVTVPLKETVIYQLMGYNHVCNVLDHHPAREVSAILLLFFIIPMSVFVVTSYFRTRAALKKGVVPRWCHVYSLVISPYCLLATGWTYMWSVNPPDDEYGFIAHYLPWLALQIAISLLAVEQCFYLIHTDRLPLGAPPVVARLYVAVLLLSFSTETLVTTTTLAGTPVIDTKQHPLVGQFILYSFQVLAMWMPIVFAALERHNGNDTTLTIGDAAPRRAGYQPVEMVMHV
mmetsp:Transcript_25604/g.40690  ORF Transcript_25604/g.40690 Transcript_25604/m.40690 type:complete len:300 (-) Transcript_25604:98-997(-)